MGLGESGSHQHTDGERVDKLRDSHKRHSGLSPRLSRLEMRVSTMDFGESTMLHHDAAPSGHTLAVAGPQRDTTRIAF